MRAEGTAPAQATEQERARGFGGTAKKLLAQEHGVLTAEGGRWGWSGGRERGTQLKGLDLIVEMLGSHGGHLIRGVFLLKKKCCGCSEENGSEGSRTRGGKQLQKSRR